MCHSGQVQLHHLAFRTRNFGATSEFYRDLVGLPVVREQPGKSIWLGLEASVLMIEHAAPDEPVIPVGSRDLVALRVDRADRMRLKAKLLAARVILDHETEYTSYFRDPDGRLVAFSDYVLAT